MTVFSVHHTTTYRYKKPVRPSRHQMLFRPRDSFDQRLESRLTVTPDPAEIRWIHDVFGNCVTLVDFVERTRLLKFESVIRLEHTPENAPDFRIEDYARSHPFVYARDELPDLDAYMRRHHPGGAVEDWLAKFVTTDVSRPTGRLLMTLNEAIAEGFSYKRRASPGTQTPNETLAKSARDLQRLRFAYDGSGALVGFRRALRYRVRLCARPRWTTAPGRRLDPCLVPDLRPWIGLDRIRSDKRYSWKSRSDQGGRRQDPRAGDSVIR